MFYLTLFLICKKFITNQHKHIYSFFFFLVLHNEKFIALSIFYFFIYAAINFKLVKIYFKRRKKLSLLGLLNKQITILKNNVLLFLT